MKVRRKGLATVRRSVCARGARSGNRGGAGRAVDEDLQRDGARRQRARVDAVLNATFRLTLKNSTEQADTRLGELHRARRASRSWRTSRSPASRLAWTALLARAVSSQFRSTRVPALTAGRVRLRGRRSRRSRRLHERDLGDAAKQSNDFSGNRGTTSRSGTSRRTVEPLGSFTFDPIGTDDRRSVLPADRRLGRRGRDRHCVRHLRRGQDRLRLARPWELR